MKRFKPGLSVTALCLLLVGCAMHLAANTLPLWVMDPESVYASGQYLMAVGEGDTLLAAETVAMGRLAGRFKTRVQSTQRLSDQVQETFGAVGAYEKKSAYQSEVRLEADQTLLNVETAQRYRDGKGRAYVLVLLDRVESSQRYKQTIIDNIRRIEAMMETDPSKLIAYARSQQALKLGLKNQELMDQLAVIHVASARQISLSYDLESLRTQAVDATRAIRFKVSLEGSRSEPLEQQIRTLMTARGFVASSTCDLCIAGTLAIETTDFLRKDIRTVRYHVAVNMKDQSGQTLMAMQKEGRESHVTFEQAYHRAQRTVHQLVEMELLDQLETLIENLAGKS